MSQLTPHFSLEEAQCPCGCVMPPDIQKKAQAMAHIAEVVRAELGVPMIVDSWYRCPKHNVEVGGDPNSFHLDALGIDFKTATLTPDQVHEKLLPLSQDGRIGGLEKAPGHTHIDAGASRQFSGPSL